MLERAPEIGTLEKVRPDRQSASRASKTGVELGSGHQTGKFYHTLLSIQPAAKPQSPTLGNTKAENAVDTPLVQRRSTVRNDRSPASEPAPASPRDEIRACAQRVAETGRSPEKRIVIADWRLQRLGVPMSQKRHGGIKPTGKSRTAMKKGAQAFRDGKALKDNPFLHNRVVYSSWWEAGFLDAQRSQQK